jgi:hypothetical protein
MHDDIEEILTKIIASVTESTRSDVEKADLLSSVSLGMHRLVWPILLSHVPQYLLDDATKRPEQFTMDDYLEMIDVALKNPATAKEMHDELKGALEEVQTLLLKSL